jgi:hypothetical protein
VGSGIRLVRATNGETTVAPPSPPRDGGTAESDHEIDPIPNLAVNTVKENPPCPLRLHSPRPFTARPTRVRALFLLDNPYPIR